MIGPSFGKAAFASSVGMIANFTPFVAVAISVFMAPMSQDLGWGRDILPSMLLTASLIGAVMGVIFGRLLDRHPVHLIAAPTTALIGLGILLLGAIPPLTWMYYAVFVLFGMTFMCPLIAIPKVMTAWAGERPGLAVGLFFGAAAAIGFAISPLLSAFLIENYGWRVAFQVLGGIVILITTPITWFMLRMPANLERAAVKPKPVLTPLNDPPTIIAPIITTKRSDIFGRRTFWFVIISIAMFWMAIQGLRVHFVSLATDRTIQLTTASAALSLMGGSAFIGNISIGWLMDRFKSPAIVVPFFALATLGLAIVALTTSSDLLMVGAIILGIGTGAEVTAGPVLVRRFFPIHMNGEIYGYTQTAATLAASIGPLVLGLTYEATRSYAFGLSIMIGALVLGGLLVALLPAYPGRSEPAPSP